MPLLTNATIPVKSPMASDELGCEIIRIVATFSSGAATIVRKSHPEITMTRQGSTGIYDLVLPPAAVYHLLAPTLADTADDPANAATHGNWGVVSPTTGAAEVRFIAVHATNNDLENEAPADTATAYITILAFKG